MWFTAEGRLGLWKVKHMPSVLCSGKKFRLGRVPHEGLSVPPGSLRSIVWNPWDRLTQAWGTPQFKVWLEPRFLQLPRRSSDRWRFCICGWVSGGLCLQDCMGPIHCAWQDRSSVPSTPTSQDPPGSQTCLPTLWSSIHWCSV